MNWLRENAVFLICMVIFLCLGSLIGWFAASSYQDSSHSFFSPLVSNTSFEKPLQKYSIPQLQQTAFSGSPLTIESRLSQETDFTAFQFSYLSSGSRISGQLNIPNAVLAGQAAKGSIIMVRGYVPAEAYQTGVGTKNAAAVFARAGYLTFAPDFLGFGSSDPEPENSWQARFIKPVNVIDLYMSVLQLPTTPVVVNDANQTVGTLNSTLTLQPGKIGFWAHSNGGAIVLTALEVLQKSIPTTLWAPVTVPFPYSVLYFGDELADEGKEQRAWLALFEKEYDVFDFTLTKHLDSLQGPIQLHQGSNDDAVLKWWSDEFVAKITEENKRRATQTIESATMSASAPGVNTEPIALNYFVYPGADHNLQPSWNTVIERDLQFFKTQL